MPPGFIAGLKTAATGPYGLVAFICLIAAWAYVAVAQHRLNQISKVIHLIPEAQRAELLVKEYNVLPKTGVTPEVWIRSRKHILYFAGFLALILAAVVLATIALNQMRRQTEVAREPDARLEFDCVGANDVHGLVGRGLNKEPSVHVGPDPVLRLDVDWIDCHLKLGNVGNARLTDAFVDAHFYRANGGRLLDVPTPYELLDDSVERRDHGTQLDGKMIRVIEKKVLFPEAAAERTLPDATLRIGVPDNVQKLVMEWKVGGDEQPPVDAYFEFQIVRPFVPSSE